MTMITMIENSTSEI